MKEEWKKQMQQKMADYRESDIEVSWDEIEKALAANRKPARVVPMRWKRIAAAVAFLLLAGGGYWMLKPQRTAAPEEATATAMNTPAVSEDAPATMDALTPTDAPAPAQAPASPIVKNIVAQAIAAVKAEATAAAAIAPETNDAQPQEEVAEQPQQAQAQPQQAQVQPQETKEAAPQPTTTQPQETTAQHRGATTQQLPPLYPADLRKSTSSQPRLTAKVYLSNTMAGSSWNQQHEINHLQKDVDPYANAQTYPDDEYKAGISGNNSNSSNENEYQGNNGETGQKPDNSSPASYFNVVTTNRINHRQPIRFGFSLRYRLGERWSVESGLTYTRLSADITHSVDGKATETEQRLNYLGIPVSASYQLWGSRYFNFYLSAGGLVEKMIKGSRTTQGVSNSVSIHPLQLSVNGALGAEFNIIDNLSLYAEPALNYYFDNGSAIPTFYQEKPLNFNLNVGLRFNIK